MRCSVEGRADDAQDCRRRHRMTVLLKTSGTAGSPSDGSVGGAKDECSTSQW